MRRNRYGYTSPQASDRYAEAAEIVDLTSDGCAIRTMEGELIFVNRALCDMLGYDEDELVGQSVADFLTPDSVEDYESEAGRRLAGKDSEYELNWIRKDKSHVSTLVSATFFRADGVEVAFAIVTDLTKHKQLKVLEESHDTLLGNLPGLAYRCRNDKDWTMLTVSEGCLALTGYAREDLKHGRPTFENIIHPDDRKMARTNVENALKEGRPFTTIYRIVTASGDTKWVWEQGSMSESATDDRPEVLVGFIADYTARHQVEQASVSVQLQGNVDKLSKFYNLALEQSKKSFKSSQIACLAGLGLFVVAAVMILASDSESGSESAFLIAIGGAITELLAGGYFYMYTKSVGQIDKSFEALQRVRNDTVAIRLCEELPRDLKNTMKMKVIDKLIAPVSPTTEGSVQRNSAVVEPSSSEAPR